MVLYAGGHEDIQTGKPYGISVAYPLGLVHEVSEKGFEKRRWHEIAGVVQTDQFGHGS